jgi:hypothetical protein
VGGHAPVDIPCPADILRPVDTPVPVGIPDYAGAVGIAEAAAVPVEHERKAESIRTFGRIHWIHLRNLSVDLDRKHCSMARVADDHETSIVVVEHVAETAVVVAAGIPALGVVLLQYRWETATEALIQGIL